MNSSFDRPRAQLPGHVAPPFGVYYTGGGPSPGRSVKRLPKGAVSACIAFMLAFPFPVMYQIVTYYGVVPPFLGRGHSASIAMAAPFALYAFMRNYGRPVFAHTVIGIAFLLFYVMFMARASLGLALNADPEIVFFHFMTLGQFAILFAIARYLPAEEAQIQKFMLVVFLATALLIFGTSSGGQFLNADILNKDALGEGVNYQGPAFIFMVMFIMSALGLRGPMRLFCYCVAIVALYMIGARSEFVALLLFLPAIEFCRTTMRSAYVFIIPVIGVLGSLGMTAVQFTGWEEGNRMAALLDLDSDLSAMGRRELMENAVATISQSPLFGDYASYGLGNYAHNVLSAWVDFGVFGFLLTCLVCFGPLIALIYASKTENRNLSFVQSLACAIALAVLMLMAKAYSYFLIPVAIGIYCRHFERFADQQRWRELQRIRNHSAWLHENQPARPHSGKAF